MSIAGLPNFNAMVGSGPYKGELIDVGQFSFYAEDEYFATPRLSLTYGVRTDFPTYFTHPIANPFSTSLRALDQNGQPEKIDQAKLPGATPMFSPRVGFNWDVHGDQSTRFRGGSASSPAIAAPLDPGVGQTSQRFRARNR